MKAARGHRVTLIYKVTDDEGRVLDQALSDAPMEVTLGDGNLLPAVEERLEGLRPGQRASFELDPSVGPEHRGGKGLLEVPRAMLPAGLTPQVGAAVLAEGTEGTFTTWIREVRDDVVILDTSHPLSALTLHVELEVLDVREE
jgi:FKBP-type peptidyl-prolyl cis-trans isomerase SlyD